MAAADQHPELDLPIEKLRNRIPKDRRPSITELIDRIGVSRSRWYRMMASGEMTLTEAQALAHHLGVSINDLAQPHLQGTVAGGDNIPGSDELEAFVGNLDRIIRTLSTGESAKLDPRSKLAILNGIEEAARIAGQKLPDVFWELRRAVTEGRA